MNLETLRLLLRPLTPDDFEAAHSWGSNPENTRYMAWGPNDEEQTKAFLLQAKPGCDFAVVLKDANVVIGSCGIYPNETNYMGDVGWILHIDYWKRGYGTELGHELIRYGFEDLGLCRIQAPCAAVNYGSYRIMERVGMKREALRRKAFWARVDKEWIDEAQYAILAEDYRKGKTQKDNMEIRQVDETLREKIQPILDETWGSPLLAVNGKLWDSRTMPGYAAVSGDDVLGYLLYEFHDGVCEIMVLESVVKNIGIATSLIEEVKQIAKINGTSKVVVQTSNDNTYAFRFYQRRGFRISEFRLGAMETARQLKPSIPLVGEEGIPLSDEIEFEIDV
jgi:RimJ/RimL family protein N-acetyltransferase/GNAT superfamily N-acetyltransferase